MAIESFISKNIDLFLNTEKSKQNSARIYWIGWTKDLQRKFSFCELDAAFSLAGCKELTDEFFYTHDLNGKIRTVYNYEIDLNTLSIENVKKDILKHLARCNKEYKKLIKNKIN